MFYFAAPFLAGGLVLSIVLGAAAGPSRARQVALGTGLGVASLVAAFFVAASVPALRFISDRVIQGVADGYELMTGQTPYAAEQRR